MVKTIHVKKGLNIPLQGESKKNIYGPILSNIYGILISDFHNIVPKMQVKIGDKVKSGDVLFISKSDNRIVFPSPINGKIIEINRGIKRKILNIKILHSNNVIEYKKYNIKHPKYLSYEEIKNILLESGCWTFIKQRPYDILAFPDKIPKSIFIIGCDTNPLAPDLNFILQHKKEELFTSIEVLKKLTKGKIYFSFNDKIDINSLKLNNVEFYKIYGPHPAGNASVLINHINPINKGDVVWIVYPQDLIIIGEFFITGKWNPNRIIAISGPQVKNPCYIKTRIGTKISDLIIGNIKNGDNRIISGNIFTGTKVNYDDYLRYYSNQIIVINEGNNSDLFGWLFPKKKFSILNFCINSNKKYSFNTNFNGDKRSFLITGWYEKYFPFDIYPIYLLKAIINRDLEKMENLGIYEISPEDFALTEYIDISKLEHQKIVREGLDFLIDEIESNDIKK